MRLSALMQAFSDYPMNAAPTARTAMVLMDRIKSFTARFLSYVDKSLNG